MSNKIELKVVQEANPAKKQPRIERLENVHLMYVKMQKPVNKFESEDKEFTLTFVCDEDTSDSFSEKFPKASVKKIKTEQFEEKHKFKPPFLDDKNQYVIKMSVRAEFKDKASGEMVEMPYFYDTRPKVYELTGGKAVDVTMNKLVGNGSKGHIQYAVSSNSFGTFPYLRAVLITDMIEYESSGGGTHNPFADMNLELVPDEQAVQSAESKPAAKQEKQEQSGSPFNDVQNDPFDDFSSDIPF